MQAFQVPFGLLKRLDSDWSMGQLLLSQVPLVLKASKGLF
jgi:hypothetical protein